MTTRAHNFNAGPAALPLPVLQQAQAELLDFGGTGMSILESSHRGPVYDEIHQQAIADLKVLFGGSDDHTILFMGGGAQTQFALIPMNLLPQGEYAAYLETGVWGEAAREEAAKVGDARTLWSSSPSGHDRVPGADDYEVSADAVYLHYTSNNSIMGTQFHTIPQAGNVPLVCDMSSDILTYPIDLKKFGLILRRRPEEPGRRRCHPGGHTTGYAGPLPLRPADDAELHGHGGNQLAAEHAAGVCHLYRRSDRPAHSGPRRHDGAGGPE